MNDLEDLLTRDGSGFRTPPVAPPDVAVALRRADARRARLIGAGAVAVVALMAIGGAVYANLPGTLPAVPDPMATPTVTPVTPAPTPPGGVVEPTTEDVAAAVHDVAAQRGVPAWPVAVRTTWAQAQELLPAIGPEQTGFVWVAQVTGEFTCDSCTPKPGPEPSYGVVVMVLEASTLHTFFVEVSDTERTLDSLGEVVDLGPGASPSADELGEAVQAAVGALGTPTSGVIVRATLDDILQLVNSWDSTEPTHAVAWLAQLDGTFTCDATCTRQDAGTTGTVLTVILDINLNPIWTHVDDTTRDLAPLGTTYEITLPR